MLPPHPHEQEDPEDVGGDGPRDDSSEVDPFMGGGHSGSGSGDSSSGNDGSSGGRGGNGEDDDGVELTGVLSPELTRLDDTSFDTGDGETYKGGEPKHLTYAEKFAAKLDAQVKQTSMVLVLKC